MADQITVVLQLTEVLLYAGGSFFRLGNPSRRLDGDLGADTKRLHAMESLGDKLHIQEDEAILTAQNYWMMGREFLAEADGQLRFVGLCARRYLVG